MNPYYINSDFQPISTPNELNRIEYLNNLAKASYQANEPEKKRLRIKARNVSRNNHLKNRIRIRLKIIIRFIIYMPLFAEYIANIFNLND